MARPEKASIVASLTDKFRESASTIFVQYQGLDVATITELRSRCRAENIEFVVRKNTLATRAARALELEEAVEYFRGPTAFAFHAEDATVAARVLKEFRKQATALELKGGLLEGRVLDAAGVERLASIPTREVLLGQLAGTLQAPIVKLARTLQALPSNLVYALAAVRDQKESAG